MTSRLERLELTREKLAVLLEDADHRTAPALAKEYRAVLAEIANLGAPAQGSKADELAKKRAARRSTA